MVAIVAGNGLGLFNTSLNTLGGGGVFGQGGLGQAGGRGFVNISNGNLILQFNDEQLSGLGSDLYHLRTYNAQGAVADADGDGWRWDGERKVKHTGMLNASGSQVTRTTGDGHETVYAWNGSRYQSTEGDGAHDSIEAATILWLLPTEWVWKDGSTGVEERYDLVSGRLKSVKDTSGNTISYSYDINGRLTSVKDSSGQEMIYVYNGDGQLKRLDTKTASNGALTRQVYYLYDELGRLQSVTTDLTPADGIFPDENTYTTSYTYDGTSFRIASVTQGDGTSVAYTYELVGSEYRVKTVADASGTTTFTYDTTNRRTDVSNGLEQVWSYHYDTAGQLTQVQTPTTGGVRLSTSYAYDPQGNVISITDGAGNTISYGYDANGNRTLERDAQGNTVRYTYDSKNLLQNVIRYLEPATLNENVWSSPPDSAAQVTRYAYDSKSNLRYVVDATGVVSESRYSGTGLRLAEVTYGDALYGVGSLAPTATLTEATLNTWAAARDKTRSQLTERAYDYRGNLTKVTTHASVNSSGAGVVNTATQITEYVYSEHGQLLQTIAVRGTNRDARTTLSSTTYDGLGRVLSQVDASGTRTTVYNGASRQIAVTSSAGLTTTQTYDIRGRLVSIGQSATGETTRTTQYVYDAAGRLTMTQDPTGVRNYTFYDEAGRVSARVDGTGAVVEYVYNGAGQLIQEKGYANQVTATTLATWYNGTSVTKTLVSQIRPSANTADRVISHAYDSAGRRSSTTDAIGTVTTYGYDGRGQLVRVQTGDRVTRTFYDAAGRQAGQLDGEGYLRESIYNTAGQLVQVIRYSVITAEAQRAAGTLAQLRPSSTGALSTWYYYDNAGRQVSSVDEQGFVTETVFNEAANTLQSIRYATAYTTAITAATTFATIRTAVAGTSQTTTTAFDGLGRVSTRTGQDGTVTAYEYDSAGRLVKETAASGTTEARTLTSRYNAFGEVTGRLLGEASARITTGMTAAQITAIYDQYGLTWSYDAAGRQVSVRDAFGNKTVSYYDEAGRLTHVVNALGEVKESLYNAFGEVKEQTTITSRLSAASTAGLAGGLLTTPVKDLVAAIKTAANDNKTTYVYDQRGLLTSTTDALSFLTSYAYNVHGERSGTTRTIASGNTVTESLTYSKRGELKSRTEDVGGLNRTTSLNYDAFGRITSQVDGRGLTTTTIYDLNGRKITVRDPLNNNRSQTFDAWGRTLSETDALGQTTNYSYNDSTRTLTVSTPDGVSISTTRNRHGEVITATDGKGQSTTYTYNKDGQLLTVKNALNQTTTTNTYDNAGRLLTVKDGLNNSTTYGYDAASRMVTRTDALGTITRYAFDGQGRQTTVTEAEGKPEQRVTQYSYDRTGQVLTVTQDPSGLALRTTYSYDGLGQQVQVAQGSTASPNQRITKYTFDKLGRRTKEQVDPSGLNITTEYRYNGNDQVTRKIDARGNSMWYVYDNAGRLTDTVDALGSLTRNTYDVAGNVTSVTRYATAVATSGFGDVVASVTAPAVTNAQRTFYIYDSVGRVRYTIQSLSTGEAVTETIYDANGRVTESRQYDKAIAANTTRTLAATATALTTAGAVALKTTYVYDNAGRLTSTTDALNKTESYSYDAVGNRKTVTDRTGAVTTYNYDTVNRLVSVVDALSKAESYTYDAVGNRKTVTDRTGAVTTYNYDTVNRLVSVVDALSKAESYTYDAVGNRKTVTDRTGAVTTYNYDTVNRLVSVVDALSKAESYTYDAVGNRKTVTDRTGAVTTYNYDTVSRLVSVVDALNKTESYTYDAVGNRKTVTDRTGAVTTYNYDTVNRLVSVVDALNKTESYSYDAPGNLKTVTDRNGVVTSYNYDMLGRVVSEAQDTTGLNLVTGYKYDANGRLTRKIDARGNSMWYVYDSAGRLIDTIDALGSVTRNVYDANGRITRSTRYASALSAATLSTLANTNVPASVSPAVNAARDQTTAYAYDAAGRLISETQDPAGLNLVTEYRYDANGRLTRKIDARGNSTWYVYDNAGRLTDTVDALGGLTRNTYDANGSITSVTRYATAVATSGFGDVVASVTAPAVTNAQRTFYIYDSVGRVRYTIQSLSTGEAVTETIYDANGRVTESRQYDKAIAANTTRTLAATATALTTAGAVALKTTYVYDNAGRLTSTTDALNKTESYSYDAVGNRKTVTDRTGAVTTYNYDTVNRLVSVVDALNKTESYSYDAVGNRKTVTDRTGAVTTYNYDTVNRLVSVVDALSKAESYTYDAVGNRKTVTDRTGAVTTYNYDTVNRLVSVVDALNKTESYSYDAVGNRKTVTDRTSAVSTYHYDANDRLTRKIDARGNSTWYIYDALGRLTESVDALGVVTRNAYNANGKVTGTVRYATALSSATVAGFGNIVTSVSPTGSTDRDQRTTFVYDDTGRVRYTLKSLGTAGELVTETLYDANGRVTQQRQYDKPIATGTARTLAATAAALSTAGAQALTTSYVYDNVGRLTSTTDALNKAELYSYDAVGNRKTVTDKGGAVWYFNYDAAGRLVEQITPQAGVASINASGVVSTTLRYLVTSIIYDAVGNVTSRTEGRQRTAINNAASSDDLSQARATTYSYDASGRLIGEVQDPTGLNLVTGYKYDANGRLTRKIDARGNSTWYVYDNVGRLTDTIDALGAVTRNIYDAGGNVASTTRYATVVATADFGDVVGSISVTTNAARDQVTTYAYDTLDRLLSEAQDPSGLNLVTQYKYDSHGQLTRKIDARGNSTWYIYDALGRLTESIDALGVVTRNAYDANGKVTGTVRYAIALSSGTVAGFGNIVTSIALTGSMDRDQRTTFVYDDAGRVRYTLKSLGTAGELVTETLYDANGRVTQQRQYDKPIATGTARTLAATAAALSTAGAQALTTSYVYDNVGRLTSTTDALNKAELYSYDAVGNRKTVTDKSGAVWYFNYDAAERLVEQITPQAGVASINASGVVSTTLRYLVTSIIYDAVGNVTSRTEGRQRTAINNAASSDDLSQARTTTYAYDKVGRQTLTTLPGWYNKFTGAFQRASDGTANTFQATNEVTYDALGNAVRNRARVSNTGTLATDYVDNYRIYDATGRVVHEIDALSGVTAYTYDQLGNVQSSRRHANVLNFAVPVLGYYVAGDITTARLMPDAARDQITTYTYDLTGRLASETRDPGGLGLTTQYKYDAHGQLTRKIDARGNSTWYVYDSAGRLTDTVDALSSLTRNTYDAAGNVTSVTRYATAVSPSGFGDVVASVTAPAVTNAQRTFYIYDSVGRVRYSIQSLSTGEAVTETIYDANGRVTENRQYDKAIAANTTRTLAATATALTTAGAVALKTTYAYDNAGRLTSTTDALNKTESYSYDALGNRKTLTNKNNATWTYNYDTLGRLTEEITPQVAVWSITSWGSVVTNSRHLVTRISYDTLGNVVSRVEGIQRDATYYGVPDDHNQARTTRYEYDKVGRQRLIVSPGWYNKTTGAFQQASDGTANTFQVTTEVSYDALGNATRNRVRVSNTGTTAEQFVDSYKTYDAVGRVVHEIDALSAVTAYTYDQTGNTLTIKRYAHGLNLTVPSRGYYLAGEITGNVLSLDPDNDRTLTMTYDLAGRKTSVQQDEVSLYTFTGSTGTSTTVTAAPTTVYSYNALGQLTKETQIARNSSGTTVQTGVSKTYYYDVAGNQVGLVTGVPGTLGYYNKLEYNVLGLLTRQIEYAKALTGSWTEAALPGISIDAKDRSTAYAYDSLGRLTRVTQEGVTYWSHTVSPSSQVDSGAQAIGNLVVSETTYDGVGNVLTQKDAANNVTTTEYNALGQVTKVIEPARSTAKAGVIDPFNTTAVVASPTTTYNLNAFGQVVRANRVAGQDDGGNTQAGLTQITRTVYDASGNEISEIDTTGSIVEYKVDTAGRRIEERQQVSATMSAWTLTGTTKKSYTQTLKTTYTYDRLGLQTSTSVWYREDGTEKATTTAAWYNRFGEVMQQTLNGHAQAIYGYDQLGRVISQTNAQGLTQVSYSLAGQVSRSIQAGDTSTASDDRITYTRHNALGQVIEQHLPAFTVSGTLQTPIIQQTVDRWGNTLTRKDARNQTTTWTYNHNNQVLTETLPQTDILRENGTSYRASLVHEQRHDALGFVIQEVDWVGQTGGTFLRARLKFHNQVGQLLKEQDATDRVNSYLYDSHGNRIASRNGENIVQTQTYDAMDRLLTHGVIRNGSRTVLLTNQYDQAGRLYGEVSGVAAIEETLKSEVTATWGSNITGVLGNTKYTIRDERGNVIETRSESGIKIIYLYDQEGRKIIEKNGIDDYLAWGYDNQNYGRLIFKKDLDGREFRYSYNGFGQISGERITVDGAAGGENDSGAYHAYPEFSYEYYQNGLVKSVSENYRFTFGDLSGQWIALSGFYRDSYGYDISGAQEQVEHRAEALLDGIDAYGQYVVISSGSASYHVFYYHDAVGRLERVVSPGGNVDSATSLATAEIKYYYDEFGNRRRVVLDTTDQDNKRTQRDDWYAYDREGRVLISEGYRSGSRIVAGVQNGVAKGYAMTYDAAGRRQSSEQWISSVKNNNVIVGESYRVERYAYNDVGQLQSIFQSKRGRAVGADSSALAIDIKRPNGTVLHAAQTSELASFGATYDAVRGFRITQTDYNDSGVSIKYVTYGYRGDGRQIQELTYNVLNGVTNRLAQANYMGEVAVSTSSDPAPAMIDAAGRQKRYRYVVYNSNGTTINYRGTVDKEYAGFDDYKETIVTAKWQQRNGTAGTTNLEYGVHGELRKAVATGGTPFNRTYVTDREGKLLARNDGGGKTRSYIYYNGSPLVSIGNAVTPEVLDTFTEISSDYPGNVPGTYVVNSGDTLQRIAQTVWGDARMWYLIAEANGLDPALPLEAGVNLKIPNVVDSNYNSATTFKPYNPADIIGNTTPSPKPPPPPKKKCGGMAAIVMVVVAVVATVITAGAAAPALGATVSVAGASAASIGASVLAGGALVGGISVVGTGAILGAAFIGGVVGSAAAQLVGKAMGVVDKFSWGQVAVGGLTAVAGAGVGSLANSANASGWAATAAEKISGSSTLRGVYNYATSQVINRVAGLQTSFSWSGLAASVVGANVAGAAVSLAQPVLPGDLIGRVISGQIAAHTAAAVKDKWFGGASVDHAQIAYDAFGNALAGYWLDNFKPASASEPAPAQALEFGKPRDFLANLDPLGPKTMATEPSLMDRTKAGMLTPLVPEQAAGLTEDTLRSQASGAAPAAPGERASAPKVDSPANSASHYGENTGSDSVPVLETIQVYASAIDDDLPQVGAMVAASNPGYLDRARGTLGEWSDSAPLLPYESRIRFGNTTLDSVFSPLTEAVSQIYNAGVYGLGLLANLPALAWGVLSGKSLDTANHEIVQGSQALGPAGLMMSTPTRAGIMATARSRAAATRVAESAADRVVPVASGMSDLPVAHPSVGRLSQQVSPVAPAPANGVRVADGLRVQAVLGRAETPAAPRMPSTVVNKPQQPAAVRSHDMLPPNRQPEAEVRALPGDEVARAGGLDVRQVDVPNSGKTVTLYRVDDANFAPRIAPDGSVPVVTTKSGNERALFVNIGQPERAKEFALLNRGGNTTVTAVEVDASLLEKLRATAVYDKSADAALLPNAPLRVDINKAPDQFGLRTPDHFQWLRDAINPSTARIIDPKDL